jgi:hypothetical protein
MAGGSIVGTLVGGMRLGVIQSKRLIPLLSAILPISAVKIWRH